MPVFHIRRTNTSLNPTSFSPIAVREFIPFKRKVMHCLRTWICSDQLGDFLIVRTSQMHLHKPRQYSLLYTQAIWSSLLLLGYQPVQHVTVRNNMRFNQAQEKMMPSKDRKQKTCETVTHHVVLQQTFFISRKNTL